MIALWLEATQSLFKVGGRPNLAARHAVAPTQRVTIVPLKLGETEAGPIETEARTRPRFDRASCSVSNS